MDGIEDNKPLYINFDEILCVYKDQRGSAECKGKMCFSFYLAFEYLEWDNAKMVIMMLTSLKIILQTVLKVMKYQRMNTEILQEVLPVAF